MENPGMSDSNDTKIRGCEGCTACCQVLQVLELDKPIHTKCKYQKKGGCSDYVNRPESCQIFLCVWARGFGVKKDRPDKLGVLIEEQPGLPFGRQFFVKELRKGAAKSSRALRYFTALTNVTGLMIFLMDWDQKNLVAQMTRTSSDANRPL